MDRVYILSHTDLDGYFSGGFAEFYYKRFINNDASEVEIKHKSWTYGRNLPSTKYIKEHYDVVFVLDLCPDYDFMIDLYQHFKDEFIWIDHHMKPDTEFLEKFNEQFPGQIIQGKRATTEHSASAALLTYEYFEDNYNNDKDTSKSVPNWIKYISDFDSWNRYDETIWNAYIMPMFSFLKGEVTNPSAAYEYCQKRFKNKDFYDSIQYVCSRYEWYNYQTADELEKGRILYQGLLSIYDAEAKHGFERVLTVRINDEYKTIKAWICNTQNRSSVIFEHMENLDDYDVFIPYHFNGEKYFYSMYTFKSDIHCNEISIAVPNEDMPECYWYLTFNGHDNAAGANSEKFAFWKS